MVLCSTADANDSEGRVALDAEMALHTKVIKPAICGDMNAQHVL